MSFHLIIPNQNRDICLTHYQFKQTLLYNSGTSVILCYNVLMINDKRKPRHIAIAATVSGEAGREYLSGAFQYINERNPNWTFEVLDSAEAMFERLAKHGAFDGALQMMPHTDLSLREFRLRKIPSVFVDFPPQDYVNDKEPISFVRLNDESIGAAAANHFLSRGRFNAYACVIDEPQFMYPTSRERGFRRRLESSGAFVKTLVIPASNSSQRDIDGFQLRLSRLPRPLAVFAVRDRTARVVFEACRRFKLSVPDEVAVLGVDNDELFCNTMPTKLSSIIPNHRKIGFLAAKELNRLLRGGMGRDNVSQQSVREVILRDSTRIIPPSARIIAEALSYIDENAAGNLRVSEVAKHLGVSRRLADQRFQQSRGETILDAISRARIGKIKKCLLRSHASIAQVSSLCKFSSPAALSRFFKGQTGLTPNQWRRQYDQSARQSAGTSGSRTRK